MSKQGSLLVRSLAALSWLGLLAGCPGSGPEPEEPTDRIPAEKAPVPVAARPRITATVAPGTAAVSALFTF